MEWIPLITFADGSPAVTSNRNGKGRAIVAGLWSGLSYSAKVCRSDFDMRADFDPALCALIAAPAIEQKTSCPALPGNPLAESVTLDKDGQRSIALINWAYAKPQGDLTKGTLQPLSNLRVKLPGFSAAKSVRSLNHGPLKHSEGTVILAELKDIDLLIVD